MRLFAMVCALGLISGAAHAQDYRYDLYVDTDRDLGTGCSVVTPDGSVSGAEVRVSAEVSGTTVGAVTASECAGGVFGAGSALGGPHAVGLNTGTAGADVVEFSAPRSVFGGSSLLQLLLASSNAGGTAGDVLLTTTGQPGGGPILLGFASVPIPLFGVGGVVLLVVAVFFVARRRLRLVLASLGALLVAGAVWAANFVVDGQIGDWSGVSALALDPAGDGTGGDSGTDVRALFAADENGTVFFRVDVADLENQLPVVNPASALFLEDGAAQTIVLTGSDGDGEPLTFAIATGPTRGTLSAITPINATSASVDYTPNGNANGADSFTVIANDGVGNSAPATVSITITPVNDVPAFTRGADVSLLKDSGAQSIAAWATGISAGPADESGQALSFTTTVTSNPGLFQVAPSVAANGTLSFTPAADQNGSATVELFLMDNGGTANGGIDTSAVQSFTISFQAVNDPPSFTKGADQTVLEDAAAQTVAGWATAISPGPADEAGQTVSFTVMNDNAALFSVPPAVASNGTLSYSLAANANGTSTVSVIAQDNGGTANGGINVSAAQTFAINVTAVNDEPSFTAQNPAAVGEDSGAQTAVVATALSAGPADESAQTFSFSISGNTNPGLLNPGASIDAGGTLSFTPAPDQTGSTDLSVVLTDNGGTANGGDDTSITQIVTITVNPLVPDLVLSKSEGGTGSAPGGTIHYSLGVQNVGLDNALGVTLSETVPANSSFNPGSSTPGWTCAPDNTAGSTCSFSIGAIAAGASAAANTFAVSVIDPIPAGVDQISNSASVVDDGSSGADPTPANNSASDSTPITAQPELRLSTTDGGASTVPGATLSYTLAYGNDGNQGATGVVISAAVPTHSTFNPGSSTPGWTCAPDNNAGSTCSLAIGGLAGGASGSASFAVSVDATVAAGVTQLSHSASIADDASNGADPILINNSGSDITPISAQPDLALTKSDGGASTIGGGSVVYTLGASNAGNQDATGVRISESVPAETTFNAASSTAGWSCANGATAGTACNFNLGALAAGASQNISFAVNVNVGTVALQISNSATVIDDGANGSDPNPANNSASDTTPIDAAPAVQSTTPGEGATVGNTQALTINFSEQVDVGAGLSLSCSAGAVALSNTTGSNVASISPSYVGALPSGPCTLSLPAAAVTDVDAIDPPNQMAAPFTLNFTVDAAPTVTSSTPANGTSDVAANATISLSFSENVNASASAFALDCGAGPIGLLPNTISNANSIVMTPQSALPPTSTCVLSIDGTQVSDSDGFDLPDTMAGNPTVSFTTQDVAPTVTATSPLEAASISAAADLSVTFSEPVNFSTSSFALNCGGARSFAVSGSGSNTATINPDSNLPLGACSLTVQSSVVNGPTDVDAIDPPDALAAPFVLNFTATNAAPVLSIGATTSVAYTEDGAAVVMVPTATANDPDGTTLASATATITGNHQPGEDVLSFTNTPNISGSFVAATGTLSLVGVDSLANYQAALRSITYSNTSNTPNTSDRTISWVGNDGIDNSAVVQSTITVSALDDAPTANNLTPAAFNEDTQSLITLSYSDPEGDLATTCAITAPSNVTVTQACACAAGVCTVGVTGTANTSGAASFNYTVTANSAVSNSASATLSINPVNDAPAGTNNSATLIEDGSHVFTAVNFGFTDPNDTPPNTLLSVTLTTVPSLGSLRLSGTPQTAGAVISVADINGGLLTFEPVAAGSGTPYTSFTFQVRDNGGTANGGIDLDASANTFTLNVTPINDPPAGTDGSITADEDVSFTLTQAHFGFTDPNDTPANTLSAVRIAALPALGTLTVSGNPVVINTDISGADITAGNLRYQSALNGFGSPYTTFTFQVRDNGGTAGGGVDLDQSPNTMTVHVNPINDAPVAVAPANPFDISGNIRRSVGTGTLLIGATDVENDPLTTQLSGTPTNSANVIVNADGSFSYNPGAGYEGTASFQFVVCDNAPLCSTPVTVNLNIAGMIWFIDNNAPTCTAAASGCGRLTNPYSSLASFQAQNTNTGTLPGDNDNIFLFASGTDYTGPVGLRNNQKLLGQDASASLASITGITPPAGSDALPVMNNADAAITRIASGTDAITVNTGVNATLRGFTLGTIGTGAGLAMQGAATSFGTLTASEVIASSNGRLINLQGGTLNGSFLNSTTTGGAGHVILNTMAGSFDLGSGGLSGASASSIQITGGNIGLSYSGSVTHANNSALLSVTGGHTGSLTLGGALSASNGSGLNFNNADGSYTLTGTVTLNGGDAGIDVLNGSSGTINISNSASAITNPSGIAIDIDASSSTFTYAGNLTKTNNATTAIDITSNTGGTITLSGASKSISTTTASAVNLAANTGATINLSNGGLAITTTSGTGFNATGGASAMTVQGSNNTITSTTGTALNVQNTNIGASGLTFRSISSNGATNGIVLNSTGAAGGLTVTGNSNGLCGGAVTVASLDGNGRPTGLNTVTAPVTADCTGGTIQNSTGDGINLSDTAKISLTRVYLHHNLGNGISGSSVNGFVLANSLVEVNGDNAAEDDSGLDFINLNGSAAIGANPTAITNSTIRNNHEFELQITNSSGTLTSLQMSGNSITSDGLPINGNVTSPHGNMVNFLANGVGPANMTLDMTGSAITGNWNAASPPTTITATGVQCDHSGSGTMNCNISTTGFANNNVGPQGSAASSGLVIVDFNRNYITGTRSHGINFFADANAPFTKSIRGRVRNNVVGTAGIANSGSGLGPGIRIQNEGSVEVTMLIENNLVQETQSFQGISANIGISIGSALGGNTTSLTVLNNSFANIGSRAIAIQDNDSSAGTKPTVCVDMSSNFFGSGIVGQAGDGSWVRIRELSGTVNVRQGAPTTAANAAELDDQQDNGNDATGMKYAIGGTPQFSQAPCALP